MAKQDAAETQAEQTESGELFGHLTDADKAMVGFTDEELASMGDDDEEGEEAEAPEATETEAEGEGEAEEAEAPEGEEAETEGEEGDGEEEEGDEAGGEDASESAETAEKTGEEGGGESTDDIAEDDPAVQALLDTRSVLPSEWSLGEGGVTKAQETLAGLDAKATELATKFDQGDITAADYRAQADQIETQRQTLRGDIRDAERAFQRAQGHWEQKSVAKFLRDNPDWKASATRLQMLDGEVRRLQAESGDPFDPRHLIRAANNLNKAMGIAPKAAEPAKEAAPAKKGNPVPKGKRPDIPPTLARVPNDEINDVDGGKYARLDRLATQNPTAYEEALAKMSEAEREAYMAA